MNLADLLNSLIDRIVERDGGTRQAVIERMAEAGGIAPGTVEQILGGDITRPPDRRLRGFARVLGVTFERLVNALPEDLRDERAAFEDAGEVAGAVRAAVASGDEPPTWVRLMPRGAIKARDGRAWTVTDPAAVVAASDIGAGGVFPVVDFDHATEAGRSAPAAGWIAELQARADGIYARVDWTEAGAAALAKRLYRYISPVFTATGDKRVIRILRARLVNDPAIEQTALAKREKESDAMKEFLKTLAKALGLADDAGEDAILAAAETSRAGAAAGDAFREQVRAGLGLAEDAGVTEIAAALSAREEAAAEKAGAAPGGDVAALRATVDDLQKQLASVQGDRARDAATAAVEAAIKARKIVPAQKDWAVDYCARDPEGFRTFVDKQPALLADGRQAAGDPDAADAGGLTARQKELCAAAGVDPEKFLATRKAGDDKQKETAA